MLGGGRGIRTLEGVNPTRFPSVRHRPLGDPSMKIGYQAFKCLLIKDITKITTNTTKLPCSGLK